MSSSSPTAFVVITSIFAPTEAVRKFADMPDWSLLVVGDRKTPADWQADGATLLTADAQAASPYR